MNFNKCVFINLSAEQAKVLADWFEGQGEQDCQVWFDDRGVPAPMTNVQHPEGYMGVMTHDRHPYLIEGDVIVRCK